MRECWCAWGYGLVQVAAPLLFPVAALSWEILVWAHGMYNSRHFLVDEADFESADEDDDEYSSSNEDSAVETQPGTSSTVDRAGLGPNRGGGNSGVEGGEHADGGAVGDEGVGAILFGRPENPMVNDRGTISP
eukprot:SAG11_NODE_5576_length_1519_cov_1.973944_3_plen_132_part_01